MSAQFPIEQLINDEAASKAVDAMTFCNLANSYSVEDDISAECAADDLKRCKGLYRAIEDARKDLKAPYLQAGKDIDAYFKAPLDFLSKAESTLKRAILDYQNKINQARIEAQRKADAEAAAERRRIEDERMKAAAEARAAGNSSAAVEIEAAPVIVPVVVPPTVESPKLDGISTRTTWKGEVTDIKALLQSIIDGKCPADVVEIKQSEINKLARALNTSMNIPGLRAVQEETLSSRVA